MRNGKSIGQRMKDLGFVGTDSDEMTHDVLDHLERLNRNESVQCFNLYANEKRIEVNNLTWALNVAEGKLEAALKKLAVLQFEQSKGP